MFWSENELSYLEILSECSYYKPKTALPWLLVGSRSENTVTELPVLVTKRNNCRLQTTPLSPMFRLWYVSPDLQELSVIPGSLKDNDQRCVSSLNVFWTRFDFSIAKFLDNGYFMIGLKYLCSLFFFNKRKVNTNEGQFLDNIIITANGHGIYCNISPFSLSVLNNSWG